jgi:uncharacterized protein (UPF0261 family)
MVNFGPRDTVPAKFANRTFYQHNPSVMLMRTTPEENSKLGEEIARKAAASRVPATIILPLGGVSAIDAVGQPFDDPNARTALFDAIRRNIATTELIELEHHINDPSFAELTARILIKKIKSQVVR